MSSLSVDSIINGVVIDHIEAGTAMEIYNYLGLDDLNSSIALMQNVKSKKKGKKDIIKIENNFDIDFNVLGYLDPNITINIIENSKIVEKVELKLPEIIRNVIKCKNPRCISSIEQELEQVFIKSEFDEERYRCIYCEQAVSRKKAKFINYK